VTNVLFYQFWSCNSGFVFGHAFILVYSFLAPIGISQVSGPCFTTEVRLQFGTVCPDMSTNRNVNFHTLGYGLISYNSMVNEISIPNKNRKKQVHYFRTL
jgi:hypothetical protein